ncbi:hypothetical protein LguiA_030295 [Lonicera macranthoides]
MFPNAKAATQSDRITSLTGGTHFTEIGMVLWSCLYCRLKRNAEKWYTIIHGGLDRPDSPGHPSSSCLIYVTSDSTKETDSTAETRSVGMLNEIEAHVGGVNYLAFSKPNEQLYVITCGDDKLLRVWDVTTGVKQYVSEGHEALVYSICSHVSNGIHVRTSLNLL